MLHQEKFSHSIIFCHNEVYIRNVKTGNMIYISVPTLQVRNDKIPNFIFQSIINQRESYELLGMIMVRNNPYLSFIKKRTLITHIQNKPIYKIEDVGFCSLSNNSDDITHKHNIQQLSVFVEMIKKGSYYSPDYDLSNLYSKQNFTEPFKYESLQKNFMNAGLVKKFEQISHKCSLGEFIACFICGYVDFFEKTVYEKKISVYFIIRNSLRIPKSKLAEYEIIVFFGSNNVCNYSLFGLGTEYTSKNVKRDDIVNKDVFDKFKVIFHESLSIQDFSNSFVVCTFNSKQDQTNNSSLFQELFENCLFQSYIIDNSHKIIIQKQAEFIVKNNYENIIDPNFCFKGEKEETKTNFEIRDTNEVNAEKVVENEKEKDNEAEKEKEIEIKKEKEKENQKEKEKNKKMIILLCPDGLTENIEMIKYIVYETLMIGFSHLKEVKREREVLGSLPSFLELKEEDIKDLITLTQNEYEKEDISELTLPSDTLINNGSFIHKPICDQINNKELMNIVSSMSEKGNGLECLFVKAFLNLFSRSLEKSPRFTIGEYKSMTILYSRPATNENAGPSQITSNLNEEIPDSLKIFISTWNICAFNALDNGNINIDELLFPSKFNHIVSQENKADFYAIGFQEVVKLNAQNIMGKNNDIYFEYWTKMVESSLGEEYELLRKMDLIGILVVFFAKAKYKKSCSKIIDSKLKTGFHGWFGNKGSCVLQFKLFNKTFGFSNGHYACGEENNQKRKKDLEKVVTTKGDLTNQFIDNDFWFIFGDLNFRIVLPIDECMRYIKENNVAKLREHDQLLEILTHNKNIKESEINFLPTFKLKRGKGEYNISKRVPSWCDRIIYKNSDKIKTLAYDSVNINYSDHYPVIAIFEVNLK